MALFLPSQLEMHWAMRLFRFSSHCFLMSLELAMMETVAYLPDPHCFFLMADMVAAYERCVEFAELALRHGVDVS